MSYHLNLKIRDMRLFLLSLLFTLSATTFAQNPYRLVSVGSKLPNQPLIIVNGNVVHNETMKTIAPIEIESINILKDAASTAIYGIRGANGVVVIKLKKNAKLLSYQKLLKKFKVRKEHREYLPYLDNQPLGSTADFYASPSKIQTIRLAYRDNGISEIPYLNIVTNK